MINYLKTTNGKNIHKYQMILFNNINNIGIIIKKDQNKEANLKKNKNKKHNNVNKKINIIVLLMKQIQI